MSSQSLIVLRALFASASNGSLPGRIACDSYPSSSPGGISTNSCPGRSTETESEVIAGHHLVTSQSLPFSRSSEISIPVPNSCGLYSKVHVHPKLAGVSGAVVRTIESIGWRCFEGYLIPDSGLLNYSF